MVFSQENEVQVYQGSSLPRVKFTEGQVYQGSSLPRVKFTGVKFTWVKFTGVKFTWIHYIYLPCYKQTEE